MAGADPSLRKTDSALIRPTDKGLYCDAGDFYIDPWRPVPRAVITHAHADHARSGSDDYFCQHGSVPILEKRLGKSRFHGIDYGEALRFGEVTVSLHPAGHILGSAQVRVAHGNEVWVVTGDFKRDDDPTCAAFEVVPCDVLITEATFALPVYRWPHTQQVAGQIHDWWQANRAQGRPSILFTYALGKAQRVLAELCRFTDRAVFLHGAMVPLVAIYRDAGIEMLPTRPVSELPRQHDFSGELIIAPPSASGSPWMRRFRDAGTGFASGWMQVRGNRRRRGYDRGFVLSDHADWPSLLRTVRECGAHTVFTTHGRSDEMARYLSEAGGINACPLKTLYGDEDE
jgi:putative mRNA 3-end processing factor